MKFTCKMINILSYIFCVVLVVSYVLKSYFRMIYLASKFPGPKGLPLIGAALKFWNKSPSEIFHVLGNYINEYGGAVRFWFGPELYIVITDPKDIEAVLCSTQMLDKGGEYRMLRPWLNEGLLLSGGKKWFQRRKIITPAFHFKILEEFVKVFDRQGNIFVDILSKRKPNEQIELLPLVTLYTLDVICESAMGTKINAQLNSGSFYVKAIKELTHIIHIRIFDFFLRPNILFQYSDLGKRQKNILKLIHRFSTEVIETRRTELIQMHDSSIDAGISDEFNRKEKKTFLDVLLHATVDGKPLSDSDIREEVDTFMFEGHDTTSSGVLFSLYNIAKHFDVQRKCFDEINEIIGADRTQATTLKQLNNLTYLDKVIKESLRLFPPVPLVTRYTQEESVINEKTYPANCNITIGLCYMGQQDHLFERADDFWPERFDSNSDGQKPHTFAYVPFSAGSRNCIGQRFAVLEMKAIISKLLRNFEFRLADDSLNTPSLIAALVLKPNNAINFHIKTRIY